MEKVLFADLSEKERMQMLSDNADTVEEVGYMKAFTPEEMETMKDRLSKIVIDINDMTEQTKDGAIDTVIDGIRKVAPDIAVLEI